MKIVCTHIILVKTSCELRLAGNKFEIVEVDWAGLHVLLQHHTSGQLDEVHVECLGHKGYLQQHGLKKWWCNGILMGYQLASYHSLPLSAFTKLDTTRIGHSLQRVEWCFNRNFHQHLLHLF